MINAHPILSRALLGSLVFWAFCLGAGGAFAQPTVSIKTAPGLELVQRAQGVPGRQDAHSTVQTVRMTKDRLVLIDHATNQRFLMRLDLEPSEFYEISGDQTEYTKGRDYEKIQAQRDETEHSIIGRRGGGTEAEWKKAMQDNYLSVDAPPGRREVVVEKGETESFTLERGSGEKRDYTVRKYIIRENGRQVVEAWVTTEIPLEIPFFDFYRRLGAFSNEVLEKLKSVPGVPLRAKISVVTGTFTHPIEARVEDLRVRPLPIDDFELPREAKLLEDSPFVICHDTGEQMERTRAYKLILTDGQVLWFCTRKAWQEYRRKNKDSVRKGRPKPGIGKPGIGKPPGKPSTGGKPKGG